MSNVPHVTINEILTDEEMERAIELFHEMQQDQTKLRLAIRDELIAPNMPRINTMLGQENDADYLSYAILNAMNRAAR